LAESLPTGLPTAAADAAKDTLGGAVGVARTLPAAMADATLAAARGAFVDGMHVAAALAVVVGFGLAIFVLVALRDQATELTGGALASIERPDRVSARKPARECF
jgi:MFS transporter, DHA2 family, multidrug resistance protein